MEPRYGCCPIHDQQTNAKERNPIAVITAIYHLEKTSEDD